MTIDVQRHSAEMSAQRSAERAADDRHYRLKKACMARAVELYNTLAWVVHGTRPPGSDKFPPDTGKLLKEIANDAE